MFWRNIYFSERVSCGSFALIQPRACTLPDNQPTCNNVSGTSGVCWKTVENIVVLSLGGRVHCRKQQKICMRL